MAIEKETALAERIARKAADALSPLGHEMTIMKWPAEFRAIMWGAVAQHAAILEAEARTAHGECAQEETR